MKELISEQSHLYSIIENSEDAIIGRDAFDTITSWNHGAEKIYGYAKDEVMGKHISLIFPEGKKDEIKEFHQNILRGETVDHFITERKRKDGDIVVVSVTISPIRDKAGNIIGSSAVAKDITKFINVTREVEIINKRFNKFIENLPFIAYVKDKNMNILFASQYFCEFFRRDMNDLNNREISLLSEEEELIQIQADIDAFSLKDGKISTSEYKVHKDGKEYCFQCYRFPIMLLDKEVLVGSISIDVTERILNENKIKSNYDEISSLYGQLSAAEEELRSQYESLEESEGLLRKSEERYALAMEGAKDGLWDFNFKEGTFFLSQRSKELFEINDVESIFNEQYISSILVNHVETDMYSQIKYSIKNRETLINYEFKFKFADGSEKDLLCRGKIKYDIEGNGEYMAGSITDITASKRAEKVIRNLAYLNPITEIYNRTYAMEIFPEIFKNLKIQKQKAYLLFIDMDNFKGVNDTLGHIGGDEFLRQVANRMKQICYGENILCHLGGDEFIMLIKNNAEVSEIAHFCDKVVRLFDKSFMVNGHEVSYVTTSVGTAAFPKDGEDLTTLLNHADDAMYFVKHKSKNSYIFYEESMNSKIYEETKLTSDLKTAIRDKELILYYQPKILLDSGKISGMEALVRWRKKDGTIVPPNVFIPFAEERGLIGEIGQYVLHKACLQNKQWQDAGLRPLKVAVNLSSVQVQDENLIYDVTKILEDTGLNSKYLELEITESMIMKNFDKGIENLEKLRAMGIAVSLDDFGTGYSSLNYLRRLPIDTVKMDKSFVDNLTLNQLDNMIVRTVIQLSHGINLRVVAEGVESKHQLTLLKEYSCDEIQGYYYSKPVPSEEFYNLILLDKQYP